MKVCTQSVQKLATFLLIFLAVGISAQPYEDPIPNIEQMKEFRNFTLQYNENLVFRMDDYFEGFNLTFANSTKPNVQITDSYDFESKFHPLINAKIYDSHDFAYIGILAAKSRFKIFKIDESLEFTLVLEDDLKDVATDCTDFEFLNMQHLVFHCSPKDEVWSTENVFVFYSIMVQSIMHTTKNTLFYKHSGEMARLTDSKGFKGSSFMVFLTSPYNYLHEWEVFLVTLDSSMDIKKSEVIDQSRFTQKMTVYDVKTTQDGYLILSGSKGIFLMDSNNKIITEDFKYSEAFNISVHDVDGYQAIFTDSYESCVEYIKHGPNMVYNTQYFAKTKENNEFNIVSTATKEFVFQATNGSTPYFKVYYRGDPNPYHMFYQGEITSDLYPEFLLATFDENVVFSINEKSIQCIYLTRAELILQNRVSTTGFYDYDAQPISKLGSKTKQKDVMLSIFNTAENDYRIAPIVQPNFNIFKVVGDPLVLRVDQFFTGPMINYQFKVNGKTSSGPVFMFGIEVQYDPPYEGKYLTYFDFEWDEDLTGFKSYIQVDPESVLQQYSCYFDITETIKCRNPVSISVIGAVKEIFTVSDYHLTLVVADESGYESIYRANMNKDIGDNTFTTTKLLPKDNEECTVAYESFDNSYESNTFCVQLDGYVSYLRNNTKKSVKEIQMPDGFIPNKFLTHKDFPGLLFVSDSSGIMILDTHFYTRDFTIIKELHFYHKFTFIVTTNSLVIISLDGNEITQYDIRNIRDVHYQKDFSLFDFNIAYTYNTLQYSSNSNMIYMLAKRTANNTVDTKSMYYLLTFDPDQTGTGNIRDAIPLFDITDKSDISKYFIRVNDYFFQGLDIVMITDGKHTMAFTIYKHTDFELTTPQFLQDKSALMSEATLDIIAQNEVNKIDMSINMVVLNTQRQIKGGAKTGSDLGLGFSSGQKNNFDFKVTDLFHGPVFTMQLKPEDSKDKFELLPKAQKIGPVPFPDSHTTIDIDSTDRYIAVLTQNTDMNYYIQLFRAGYFPDKTSLISRTRIKSSYLDEADQDYPIICYDLQVTEIDQSSPLVAAYCHIAKKTMSTSLLYVWTGDATAPIYLPETEFKITYELLHSMIVLVVPNSYTPIMLYEINVDTINKKKLKVKHIYDVNADQMSLDRENTVLNVDGCTLPNMKTALFFSMSKSKFNLIFVDNLQEHLDIQQHQELEASSFYHDDYSEEIIYTGVKTVQCQTTEYGYSFEIIVTTSHALGFRMQVQADSSGMMKSSVILESYVQYIGYKHTGDILQYKDIVVIPAESEYYYGQTYYFIYDRRDDPTVIHNGLVALDASAVIQAPSYHIIPAVLTYIYEVPADSSGVLKGYQLFLCDEETGKLSEYRIRDKFSIVTNATDISSSSVSIVGMNDYYRFSLTVPVGSGSSWFSFDLKTHHFVIFFLLIAVCVLAALWKIRKLREEKRKLGLIESEEGGTYTQL